MNSCTSASPSPGHGAASAPGPDLVAAAEPDRAGLLQVDQAGLEDTISAPRGGIHAWDRSNMHLSGRVQLARQPANRPENRPAPLFGQVVPGRQPGVQVLPTVQGTVRRIAWRFPPTACWAKNAACRVGNAQRPVALDVAELAGEGRLAQRMAQAAGQVVALALQVVGGVAQVEAVDAASHRARYSVRPRRPAARPTGVEAVQTVALAQVVVLRGDEKHLIRAPRRKPPTWRIRFVGFVQVPSDGDIAGGGRRWMRDRWYLATLVQAGQVLVIR